MATRAFHYRAAERILTEVSQASERQGGKLLDSQMRGLEFSVRVAQVHATLATASQDVEHSAALLEKAGMG